ncbi:hypothetical protein ACKVV1_011437 [Pyricularia oryzae]
MEATETGSDQQYWWRTCEPALSGLLDFTGSYTAEEKQDHLAWFSQHVVPWFGRPHSSTTGISLTRDKSPVEVSLNLSTHGPARVRFGMQVIGGVGVDAFDVPNRTKLLAPLFASADPDHDLQWFHSAGEVLVSTDPVEIARAKALTPPGMKTQPPTLALGFDMDGSRRRLKTYLFPLVKSWGTGTPSEALAWRAIRGLRPRGDELSTAVDMLEEYFATGCPEKMVMVMIGLDCRDPSSLPPAPQPRVKVYGNVYTSNSWDLVSHVYTLGGKVADPDRMTGLTKLKSVWHLLLGEEEPLPEGYSKPLRDPTSPHGAFTTSFELSPGCAAPDVKIYVSVWQYGADDAQIAANVAAALRILGFEKEADGYLDMLKRAFPYADLAAPCLLHTYVTYAYSAKTGVYLTVYLSASGESVSIPIS